MFDMRWRRTLMAHVRNVLPDVDTIAISLDIRAKHKTGRTRDTKMKWKIARSFIHDIYAEYKLNYGYHHQRERVRHITVGACLTHRHCSGTAKKKSKLPFSQNICTTYKTTSAIDDDDTSFEVRAAVITSSTHPICWLFFFLRGPRKRIPSAESEMLSMITSSM